MLEITLPARPDYIRDTDKDEVYRKGQAHLCEVLSQKQSNVSRSIRKLISAKAIEAVKAGRERYFKIRETFKKDRFFEIYKKTGEYPSVVDKSSPSLGEHTGL